VWVISGLDAIARAVPPGDPEHSMPRVLVGGLVTHRQRPATARGVSSTALLVRGRLERSPEGVLNLVADRLQKLASRCR
jgi:error-prone DNA polymerase